jgi:hypothetical protein
MVMVKPSIEGLAQMRAALASRQKELDAGIHEAVTKTGLWLHGDIIKRYQRGPASGRVYTKYSPRRRHQASAPWQAPQTDTGRLAGGMTFRQLPDGVEIVNRVKYARALEYGHKYRTGQRILPRPAWRPARYKAEQLLDRLILDVINRFTR